MNLQAVAGALALYHGKCAAVTGRDGDKIVIRMEGGVCRNVRGKDITLLHPGPVAALPPAPPERPSNEVLSETAALLDGASLPFDEFAELLFGSFTPGTALGVWRLLEEDCFFAGSPDGGVCANAPEKVRDRLEKERFKIEQARAKEALLSRIREGALVPEDLPRLREIEAVACGESASSRLLHDLGIGALPEKAQNLLLKLKVWDVFRHDPWPRRFAVPTEPEYPVWPDALPEEPRQDLTHLASYAIDDAESCDPDDAVGVDENGWLWVHVADPGAAAGWDTALERFAAEQGGSLYLPEKVVPMLPPEAAAELGLGLKAVSPALSFAVAVDAEGGVELKKMVLSRVRVTRLDYDGAEALLADEPFRTMLALTGRFRERRRRSGAVMIQLPEVKIKADPENRTVSIRPLAMNRVREMVANAMLAAGKAVADFAVGRDIPMPFSVQAPPEMEERPEDLCGMYALRKSCQVSTLSVVPGRHAGLGLEPYVRVTSPLRRYEDLLAHLQLRRVLKGQPLLDGAAMEARLALAEPASVLRRKLERQCDEYWTLVYLQEHPDWEGTAVPVYRQDDRITWLLPELGYEFKNRFGGKTVPGEAERAVLTGVDPASMSVQFRLKR